MLYKHSVLPTQEMGTGDKNHAAARYLHDKPVYAIRSSGHVSPILSLSNTSHHLHTPLYSVPDVGLSKKTPRQTTKPVQ